MSLRDEHIDYIKVTFSEMKVKTDLVELLNYVKKNIYGEKYHPFHIRQINYYSNSNICEEKYKIFSIKKKKGGFRTIYAPNKGLKTLQECLNIILQAIYNPHPAATGFVPGKSIVDNAKVHVGNQYVYNIDLKDFFPSIDQARIWARLKLAPFNLNVDSNRLELANIIAGICCCRMEVERLDEQKQWKKEIRSVLPQGAPTSPFISNIICQQLDYFLSGIAKTYKLHYTRYADDITFSGTRNVFNQKSKFITELHRIIRLQNFHINESKRRLQKQEFRQEVTGLVVNKKINIPKRYVKQLRLWLYYWDEYGYDRANSYFTEHYRSDKGHIRNKNPDLAKVLSGKLDYMKMVKGEEDSTYINLKKKFIALISKKDPINEILDIWEKEGIERAMQIFYLIKLHN